MRNTCQQTMKRGKDEPFVVESRSLPLIPFLFFFHPIYKQIRGYRKRTNGFSCTWFVSFCWSIFWLNSFNWQVSAVTHGWKLIDDLMEFIVILRPITFVNNSRNLIFCGWWIWGCLSWTLKSKVGKEQGLNNQRNVSIQRLVGRKFKKCKKEEILLI